MSIKKWNVVPCDLKKAEQLAEQVGIPVLLSILLQGRGIDRPEQVDEVLRSELCLSDPFLLADMDKAVERILSAIDHFESIAVYGDYDADGVTATAMLYSYLESCGANVIYYIPDREGEGYGLNINAIRSLHQKQVNLIVTVDNGISSVDEVKYANGLGMDVVVTDHHRPREILPEACAVVDPYRADNTTEFKDFSGVGVAFKLIMALEGEDCDLTALLDNYADLAAIGTIGDVVPLTGENRCLVKAGLKLISRTDRIGLRSLIEQAGLEGRQLTSNNIAFTIVPRINATGRIDSPDCAVRLLLSEFPEEAGELAVKVCDDNDYRRQIENEIYQKAIERLKSEPEQLYDRVLVIEGEKWHPGVIGIVSSRITEQFGKPSIIISCSGTEAKGSGRSVEGFSLFEAICSCKELLIKFGGHPMAAGLTLPTENVAEFRNWINRYAAGLNRPMPLPALRIDCLLKPGELSLDIPKYQSVLEPFGTSNPSPLFGLFGVTLSEITPVGGGKHLRVSVTKENYTIRCMKFGTTLEEFPYRPGDELDLAVALEAKEYNGKNTLSIYIRDIKLSKIEQKTVFAQCECYERFRRGEKLSVEEIHDIVPSREDFAAIYRFLRSENGFSGSIDALLGRLDQSSVGMHKLLLALDIFHEHGLIRHERFGDILSVTMLPATKKVNLFDSYILKSLNSCEKAGEPYGVAAQNI
ncbi:MAG TPA: single-stranded-DNA-specific exonuclease RecJ [Caproiciproducens sp.]|nr:single-stranded-DNA-specific exonuclease RecJ [Caproiciproducens sp.]